MEGASAPSFFVTLTPGKIQVSNSKVFAKLGNGTVRDLTLDTNTVYTHPSTIQCSASTEISSLKSSVSSGKAQIASAITGKGVSTSSTASFSTMASNINSIYTPDSRLIIPNSQLRMGATNNRSYSWEVVSCTAGSGVIGYQGPNAQYFYTGSMGEYDYSYWQCALGDSRGMPYAHSTVNVYASIVYSPPFSGTITYSTSTRSSYVDVSVISSGLNVDRYNVTIRITPITNSWVTWSFSAIDLTLSTRYTGSISVTVSSYTVGQITSVP